MSHFLKLREEGACSKFHQVLPRGSEVVMETKLLWGVQVLLFEKRNSDFNWKQRNGWISIIVPYSSFVLWYHTLNSTLSETFSFVFIRPHRYLLCHHPSLIS